MIFQLLLITFSIQIIESICSRGKMFSSVPVAGTYLKHMIHRNAFLIAVVNTYSLSLKRLVECRNYFLLFVFF